MNETYEIRLREEFLNLRALQNDSEMQKILEIEYQERNGNSFKSILHDPLIALYPTRYKVTYKMPVYVDEGQLNTDWKGVLDFRVNEDNLMKPDSKNPEYDFKNEGGVAFNSHMSAAWFCLGTVWEVSHQGFGLWYFVIGVGCILNQEKGWTAYNPDKTDAENGHLNYSAFIYWKNVRKMQPINNIKWPLNLRDKKFKFGDEPVKPTPTPVPEKKFKIGKASDATIPENKKAFTIVKPVDDNKQPHKFKIGKANEN